MMEEEIGSHLHQTPLLQIEGHPQANAENKLKVGFQSVSRWKSSWEPSGSRQLHLVAVNFILFFFLVTYLNYSNSPSPPGLLSLLVHPSHCSQSSVLFTKGQYVHDTPLLSDITDNIQWQLWWFFMTCRVESIRSASYQLTSSSVT